MSDDLVRRIADKLRRYELNNGTLSGTFDRAKASRDIAALIAEARASARREALEEARFYAAQRIGFLEQALQELDTEDDALEADDIHQQLFEAKHIERHLRALADKVGGSK